MGTGLRGIASRVHELEATVMSRARSRLPAQWIGMLIPLTYFLEVVRGILLKGSGMAYLWRETLALALFSVVLLTIGVRRFSKTIE